MFQVGSLRLSEGVTLFAGLLAAAIVWWQGHLIKEQMQLQAIIELAKEWNSVEILKLRSGSWDDNNKPNKEHLELVLEFLEKVSTFEKRGVISDALIWILLDGTYGFTTITAKKLLQNCGTIGRTLLTQHYTEICKTCGTIYSSTRLESGIRRREPAREELAGRN